MKIQHWKPQSKFLRYYIESYFHLCSEGQHSIISFDSDDKSGTFICFKKNAWINKDNTSISIHSHYGDNKVSLEIYERFNENITQQRVYNGAITEIILKLNEKNQSYLFSNLVANKGSIFIENFQFLYPNMELTVNLLFCNKTSSRNKIKHLDQMLIEYYSFIQLNGIDSILKKNKIINAN
jgi:hypothetical protein